jgi:anti-sigma B factor antagonist
MSATHAHTDQQFHVDVKPDRDIVHVRPQGDVDLASVGEIRERFEDLTALGFGRLVLDLRGVTFLDSTGIRLVLELSASSRADGWEFGVVEGSAGVQRVFELTGIRPLVPFVELTRIRTSRWGSA